MWLWNLLTWNVTRVLTMQVAMLTLLGMCLSGGQRSHLSSISLKIRGLKIALCTVKSDAVFWDRFSKET